MPLEVMLKRMRDKEVDWRERIDCAKSAAPYCHPRLASTEISGPDKGPVQIEHKTPQERAAAIAHILADIQHRISETRH